MISSFAEHNYAGAALGTGAMVAGRAVTPFIRKAYRPLVEVGVALVHLIS